MKQNRSGSKGATSDDATALMRLVTRAKPLFRKAAALRERYEAVGLDPDAASMTTTAVRDRLSELIRDEMGPSDGQVRDLRALEKHLWLRNLADGLPCLRALAVIAELKDATRETGWPAPPLTDSRWPRAVQLALTSVVASGRAWDSLMFRDPRIKSVALAARELREAGYPIQVKGDRVDVASCEEKLLGELDGLARNIGGVSLAELIFAELEASWDANQQRYNVVRRVSSTGIQLQRPLVPYGMMVNQAVKHIDVTGQPGAASRDFARLRALSTAYAATIDVQPYLQFDGAFTDRKSILPYLQQVAAFDSMFTLPQAQPSRVAEVLIGLLSPLAEEVEKALGVSISALADVARTLLAPNPLGVLDFSVSYVASAAELSRPTAQRALEVLSHDDPPNAQFSDPLRMDQSTFWSFPLIRADSDFRLFDRALCAPLFYEAVMTRLRAARVSNVDERVGGNFESFVRARFGELGIVAKRGTYVSTLGEGECDAVIETPEVVIFLELKKKALTRKARSARAEAILLDLTNGMLAPHAQTGRHELAILKDGKLELRDGPTASVVELGGRRVERLAITLPEFGAFHSREISMHVLNLFTGVSVSSSALSAKELKQINDTCERLGENYVLAGELGVEKPERFFNCWFLGLEALLTLLQNVSDAASFWRELRRTRHVSTGSLNWHFDYEFARKLDPKLAEAAEQLDTTLTLGG